MRKAKWPPTMRGQSVYAHAYGDVGRAIDIDVWDYCTPRQMRALSKWLLKAANWVEEPKLKKRKKK